MQQLSAPILLPQQQHEELKHGDGGCSTDEAGDPDDANERTSCGSMASESYELLDAIDEAWDHVSHDNTLVLRQVQLNTRAVRHLLLKCCEAGYFSSSTCSFSRPFSCGNLDMSLDNQKVLIKRLMLVRCSFRNQKAINLVTLFLTELGPRLEEVSIAEGSTCIKNKSKPMPSCSSVVLGCLSFVTGRLGSLDIQGAVLRGTQNGRCLLNILARNSNLKVLQLYKCRVDDTMIQELCVALKCHAFNLRYLDLGGWKDRLGDSHFECIVDAMTCYKHSCPNLKILDLSESAIGENSLKSLTTLLISCPKLQEIILCSCHNLLNGVTTSSPFLNEFVQALHGSSSPSTRLRSSCTTEWLPRSPTSASASLCLGYGTRSSPFMKALMEVDPEFHQSGDSTFFTERPRGQPKRTIPNCRPSSTSIPNVLCGACELSISNNTPNWLKCFATKGNVALIIENDKDNVKGNDHDKGESSTS